MGVVIDLSEHWRAREERRVSAFTKREVARKRLEKTQALLDELHPKSAQRRKEGYTQNVR